MSTIWRNEIETLGGRFTEGAALSFDDSGVEAAAASSGTIVSPLPDRALIALSGEPAEGFLQTQLTCDVRGATGASSVFGAYCNPKGRVISVFRLFRWGERFVISVLADAAETTEQRLTLFRMRTPVTIERLDDVASLGVAGPDAAKVLSDAELPTPGPQEVAADEDRGLVVLGLPAAGAPRYELHAPIAPARRLLENLRSHATLVGTLGWRLHAIRAGELDLAPALSEGFTANMLSLYELGAVNFEKGCFPGQEVVARTHHLGKAPRRLYHAEVPTAEVPAPATKLRAFRGEQARDAGVVVEAAPGAGGRVEMLAVLAEAHLDADAIRLGDDPAAPALGGLRLVPHLGG
jgi:hypothetical protein